VQQANHNTQHWMASRRLSGDHCGHEFSCSDPANSELGDGRTHDRREAGTGKVMARRARDEPSHSSGVELPNALELHDLAKMPSTKQSVLHGQGGGRPRAMGCAQACATAQWNPCAQARSPQRAARTRPWSPSASDRSRRSDKASIMLNDLSPNGLFITANR
jgi:hypothetical protein